MTDPETSFYEHAAKVHEYRTSKLSESDTRAYLIDPVLRLLGYWGIDYLRHEVSVPATKESLDYELVAEGKPHAIVEAKAVQHRIIDRHAAQCVQYASVLGIRWCFITNGIQWALYDAHGKGPLAEKKVAEVRLDGDERSVQRAWDMLSLFRREAVGKPSSLASLLAERVLLDELGSTTSPVVAAIKSRVRARFGERVPGQAVVSAFKRLLSADEKRLGDRGEGSSENEGQTSPREKRERSNSRGTGKGVQVSNLVAAGLLPAAAVLEAEVHGVSHVARLRDGKIELNGVLHTSLSAAAGALPNVGAMNGWVTWSYKGEMLAEIRRRYLTTHAANADNSIG